MRDIEHILERLVHPLQVFKSNGKYWIDLINVFENHNPSRYKSIDLYFDRLHDRNGHWKDGKHYRKIYEGAGMSEFRGKKLRFTKEHPDFQKDKTNYNITGIGIILLFDEAIRMHRSMGICLDSNIANTIDDVNNLKKLIRKYDKAVMHHHKKGGEIQWTKD